jgi:hypothetical protein
MRYNVLHMSHQNGSLYRRAHIQINPIADIFKVILNIFNLSNLLLIFMLITLVIIVILIKHYLYFQKTYSLHLMKYFFLSYLQYFYHYFIIPNFFNILYH